MIRRPARLVRSGLAAALALLGLLLSPSLSSVANAAEPEAVVVRNRLYSASGRLELQLNYSFSVANTMTSTQGPVLDVSYHVSEAWAIDLLVGYMFGGPTDLAGQAQCPASTTSAAGGAANCSPSSNSIFYGATTRGTPTKYNDLPSLWSLNGLDAQIGVHWEPIYGKLSLVTAVPVHFKWYIGLYGGVAQFSRDSFDFCSQYEASAGGGNGDCATTGSLAAGNLTYKTAQDSQFSWVASAATGIRFIFLDNAALNAGLREYVWGDSYRVNFSTTDFSNPPSSSIQTKSGITPSLFADLGLSWTF